MKKTSPFLSILLLILIYTSISASAQNIPDFLVNEQGSIDGSQQAEPYMAGDGNGNYVVTWKDKRNGTDFDIFAQICLSDGTPLGDNFKVNDDNGTRRQYTPTVAVDPNLNFVIAWIDRRNGDPNNHWDLYAQRYSSDGTALGDNFIVNDELETEEKSHPSVSIDSLGNFVIVWGDKRNEPWDIFGQRFLSDGTALGNNFRINDDIGNYYQLWPTCACDKSGNLIVSWTDKRYNTDRHIYAQRYSFDGIALGNNFQVNDNNAGTNNILPDIAIDGNSNFIIAWEDNRNGYPDIYAQRFMSDGTIVGDNFNINDDTPDTRQCNPSIISDLEGNFTVCWEDSRNDYNDVYARQFLSNGTPVADDFKVSNDLTYNAKQENAIIGSDEDGNFKICWEDHRFGFNGEIFAQSYLNDGTPVDENFMVNDDFGSENQKLPSLAVDGNENIIVVWADDRLVGNGIYGKRFTIDGIQIGDQFKVNDDAGDNWTKYPSVAAYNDGSFVVTWSDTRLGDLPQIFAQRFANDATPLGNNFQVNFLSAAINYKPEVVCKPNGDFIICWGDATEDSKYNSHSQIMESNSTTKKLIGAPDIWAQQYLNDGTPIGENFIVNDDGGFEAQMNPDIAIDASGNFVVVWEDKRNGIYEIYLQQYLSDGTPLGSNFKAEEIILCDRALAPSISMDQEGNFYVTWRDNRNDVYNIFCKQFSSYGIPIGNSFQVNIETGIDYRYSPSISINESGSFTIAWTNVDEGNYDIYAQQFLNDSTPYGNNYRISITDEMEQSAPGVVLGDSRIFYVWQDNSDGHTGFDIWAKVMDWDTIVGIDNNSAFEISQKVSLLQNYPNPFKGQTNISYYLVKKNFVSIKVFDLIGRIKANLVNETKNAGNHQVLFKASDLENGVYYYQLKAGDNIVTRKMMVLE